MPFVCRMLKLVQPEISGRARTRATAGVARSGGASIKSPIGGGARCGRVRDVRSSGDSTRCCAIASISLTEIRECRRITSTRAIKPHATMRSEARSSLASGSLRRQVARPSFFSEVPTECLSLSSTSAKYWCRKRDSNPRPHHYEARNRGVPGVHDCSRPYAEMRCRTPTDGRSGRSG